MLLNIIVGGTLTIGGVYIYDMRTLADPASPGRRPMVNWDVVEQNFNLWKTYVREHRAPTTALTTTGLAASTK
jgi:hypothetical protein